MGGRLIIIRKALFWLHLSAGTLAGIVIFIMSLTGVMLAWQRQMIHWAGREFHNQPQAGQAKLAPEALFAAAAKAKGGAPTALILRSAADEPAAAEFGRESTLYINPYSGQVLGEGSRAVRAFFRVTEDWHRWLAAGIESRATARGITGAANLIFLGVLISGVYLWLPKMWTMQYLRPAIWFRRGRNGRARDWNWHNTFGIWCVVPLIVIVGSGVVMSYPWANDLVYRITGSEVPQPSGPGRGGAGGRGGPGRSGPAFETGRLNAMWAKAEQQVPEWKIITFRPPASPRAPIQFQIDSGDGGRPQLRGQLTFDRKTGDVTRWEPFSSNSPGRRLRTWLRFSHTGEAFGIPGETIAALASAGAMFLVWTGISLAIRRLLRSVARQKRTAEPVAGMVS